MYKSITLKECRKAINWFKGRFKDTQVWEIDAEVHDATPVRWELEYATSRGLLTSHWASRSATIYLMRGRCKTDDTDMLETLFHELAHVAFIEAGIDDNQEVPWRIEYLGDSIGSVCAEAYRKRDK